MRRPACSLAGDEASRRKFSHPIGSGSRASIIEPTATYPLLYRDKSNVLSDDTRQRRWPEPKWSLVSIRVRQPVPRLY